MPLIGETNRDAVLAESPDFLNQPVIEFKIPGAAIAALVVLWNWDWFIPIVEGRASSMLGQQLSIEHLHVRLGRITAASADNVRIANPLDFPEPGDFARIARLSVHADVMAYLRSREIVLPEVVLERPELQALQTADRKNNYTLSLGTGGGAKIGDCASPTPCSTSRRSRGAART